MVLLEVRKDVKLTTLGGRLFQATATRRPIKDLTHVFTTVCVQLYIQLLAQTDGRSKADLLVWKILRTVEES